MNTLEGMKAKGQMKSPKQGVLLKGSAPKSEPEQLPHPRPGAGDEVAGKEMGDHRVVAGTEEEHQRVWWPGFWGGCGLPSVSKGRMETVVGLGPMKALGNHGENHWGQDRCVG